MTSPIDKYGDSRNLAEVNSITMPLVISNL